MKQFYQIAIDGPAGSGKSTIAKLIAKKLGFLYIDSGAMYRAVTLYLSKQKLLNEPENRLIKHLKKIQINFLIKKSQQLVFLNNKNVTQEIRSSLVNRFVSEVSSKKVVRIEMVKRQKQFALSCPIVMDGRDIGIIVFKNADLKIYLTASNYVRAKRRLYDLEKIKERFNVKEIIKQIQDRDNYDSSRTMSPLCKAQDAVLIDSSNLTVDEVLNKINIFLPVL